MRWSLVLIVVLISCGRSERKAKDPYTIIWKNKKAIAVSVDRWAVDSLKVLLEGSEYPVLGNTISLGDRSVFTPVIPFQRGLTYHILSGSRKLYSFTIPVDPTIRTPNVLGSYPSCDSIPANLLKMYVHFSEPMMEGRSSGFIQLYDAASGDTVKNAFLDLQPELWNEDGTVLTLWLDPGRIKQDLIPNKTLGTVLKENKRYKLVVAKGWKSRENIATSNDFEKSFVTKQRDILRPDPRSWTVTADRDTVVINTNEVLDWSLLHNTISIASGRKSVASKVIVNDCERQISIIPVEPLAKGDYSIVIESKLEDLAGNNLNRLFETDVTTNSKNLLTKELYTLQLHIN
jgi:hypothetical protein